MRFIKFVAGMLFFLFFMVFFVQNQAQLTAALELKFSLFTLDWQSQPLPFYLIVLIFFFLGALCSTLVFGIDRMRIGSLCSDARAKAQSLQAELDALKAKPSFSSPAPIQLPKDEIKA